MKHLLGIATLLVSLSLVGGVGAATTPEAAAPTVAPGVHLQELPPVALPWDLSFGVPGASCSASPGTASELAEFRQAGSCVQHGQVCRSPWVNGTCCAGLTCTYLYPGVPWYCL